MDFVARLGERSLRWPGQVLYFSTLVTTVLAMALSPRSWTRAVRQVFARQIVFTGVDSVPLIACIGAFVGISIVLQAQLILTEIGQSELIGPVLVILVVREIGPLITNFVVIGRSGTAIAAEVASMKISGELALLQALGVRPFQYIVLPRVVAVCVSLFGLALVLIVVSVGVGFLAGAALGATTSNYSIFLDSVLGALRPTDAIHLVAKTIIPGLLTSSICCLAGARSGESLTAIPQATTRAVVRSVTVLFLFFAVTSVLTYARFFLGETTP